VRIELESVVTNDDVLSFVKAVKSVVKLAKPQITEGADDVAPNVNEENRGHLFIVAHAVHFEQHIVMSTRELGAVEAVGLISEVDIIGLGLVSGTPRTLLEEFVASYRLARPYVQRGVLLGTYDVFEHPNVHYPASFYGGAERHCRDQGANIAFVRRSFATTVS
jgi:hypothetical protein